LKNSFLAITAILLVASFSSGCTPTQSTIKDTRSRQVAVDTNQQQIDAILKWFERSSLLARALNASGKVTIRQGNEEHNGNFALRSKRIIVDNRQPYTALRIDSFSIEVYGPFGITVARFMASPEEYMFHDVIHGESARGATDNKSLEKLTQLKGITLGTMDDGIYGLAPQADEIPPQDSLELFTTAIDQHILVVRHHLYAGTDAIYLDGVLPEGSGDINLTQIRVTRFERWNSILPAFDPSRPVPAIIVRFANHRLVNGVQIPVVMEALSGNNSLLLEYDDIYVNPNDLTVRIKMPKQ